MRSGVILTRTDLERGAREVGVGLRVADRAGRRPDVRGVALRQRTRADRPALVCKIDINDDGQAVPRLELTAASVLFLGDSNGNGTPASEAPAEEPELEMDF